MLRVQELRLGCVCLGLKGLRGLGFRIPAVEARRMKVTRRRLFCGLRCLGLGVVGIQDLII